MSPRELLAIACDLWREYQAAKNSVDHLTHDVGQLREALKLVVLKLSNQTGGEK